MSQKIYYCFSIDKNGNPYPNISATLDKNESPYTYTSYKDAEIASRFLFDSRQKDAFLQSDFHKKRFER